MDMKTSRLCLIACLALCLAGCGGSDDPAKKDELLDPPPPGQGLQLSTGDFEVEAGTEVQDCYFYRVRELAAAAGFPEDEPLTLHRTEIAYKPGSHHMNIFRVRTILELDPANGPIQKSINGEAACSKTVNWADWPLIANSQNDGYLDWTYPEGVGNSLQPDEWLMLQTHYVNASTQKTKGGGRVEVNLWTMPKAEVTAEMGTLFATKQSIRICQSNQTPKFSGTCQFNSPDSVRIIGANGHFHSRGKEFDMYVWDGLTAKAPPETERFYQSLAWDEPPMLISPELDRAVPKNGGVWYTCSYEWVPPPPSIGCDGLNQLDKKMFNTPDSELDCCYTFGNTVDRAEHCNVFAYYYPKTDDVNCF